MASRPKIAPNGGGPTKNHGWHRRIMSQDEITVRRGMMAYDKERESLIETLRDAVWSGAYDPDAEGVAEAILLEREEQREITREEEKESASTDIS